jgi:hypothetical protein
VDYQKCAQLMSTARDASAGKPIANNTRLMDVGAGCYAVRLHSTDVLTYAPDGSVTYHASGWRTVTTKQRMNEYGADGFRVYSNRGQWRLYAYGRRDASGEVQSWPYADGITVHADGSVTGAGEDTARELAQLRRRASEYARGYVSAMFAGEVEAPSAGDCFYCAMAEVSTGRPLGRAVGDTSHMAMHLAERYYVPSLIHNAARELGASQAARAAIAELQSGNPSGWAPIVRDQLTRLVRRYVLRELGMQS